jgi:hypothetical protein
MATAPAGNQKLASRQGFVQRTVLPAILFLFAALLFFFVMLQLPRYGDWYRFYYPVARAVEDPYHMIGFLNPAWVAWVLFPFSFLPVHVASALWMTLSILVTLWCIHRLQGGPVAMLLTLLSPAFLRFITSGQIDALPLLGFTLLLAAERLYWPAIGLVLMSAKPQVFGAGAITYWLSLDWNRRVRVLVPFLGVFALSLLVYGFWPADMQLEAGLNQSVDFSPWPYGIPVGLALLAWSIWRSNTWIGGLSTYFLVPYVSPSSLFVYTAVLFSKAPRWFTLPFFVFLWTIAILLT